jgi:hypothetical protein
LKNKLLLLTGVLIVILVASALSGCTSSTTTPAASAAKPTTNPTATAKASTGGPAFEQLSNGVILRGSGIQETKDFNLNQGKATIHIKFANNFGGYAVSLLSHDDKVMIQIPLETSAVHTYTGEPGQYDVTKTIDVPATGSYFLSVTNGGAWEITITQ